MSRHGPVLDGHGLVADGAAHDGYPEGGVRRVRKSGIAGSGIGLCECGAHSPVLATGEARRDWHRVHLRAELVRNPRLRFRVRYTVVGDRRRPSGRGEVVVIAVDGPTAVRRVEEIHGGLTAAHRRRIAYGEPESVAPYPAVIEANP